MHTYEPNILKWVPGSNSLSPSVIQYFFWHLTEMPILYQDTNIPRLKLDRSLTYHPPTPWVTAWKTNFMRNPYEAACQLEMGCPWPLCTERCILVCTFLVSQCAHPHHQHSNWWYTPHDDWMPASHTIRQHSIFAGIQPTDRNTTHGSNISTEMIYIGSLPIWYQV